MKKKRKLIWQIYSSYLVIVMTVFVAGALYASYSVKEFHLQQTRELLEEHARHFQVLLAQDASREAPARVDALCKTVGNRLEKRVTVIESSGEVIGDSQEDPARMDNHADRPEIQHALAGEVGTSIRYSYTLSQEMIYVAIPFEGEPQTSSVVRVSMPFTVVRQTLKLVYEQILLAGVIIAGLAAMMSLLMSRRISKPLKEIRQGARRYAHGDLHHRIRIPESEEIGVLAETMNQMASQLAERIQLVTKQRNELEAVLANMVEAVMIIRKDGRIVRCNQAAGQLFRIPRQPESLRSVQEAIRYANIHRFVKRTFEADEPVEDVVNLSLESERFLHVHGSLLRTTGENPSEALFVFHDITRLKQLENMRREFVANVSHELRTPITSIAGFIETLQDGAIDDPEHAKKFLSIIERNTQRLDSIIKDLLTLSQIEQGKEGKQIILAPDRVKNVLEDAVITCHKRAEDQQVTVKLECQDSLWAPINSALLEQAVVNLLDNAIKYTDQGGTIFLRAKRQEQDVIISVQDAGMGISPEHLPRLFERFYRVDKARSRKLGGTGLGLAIVKHIANAHQGSARVESTPGEGSTFSIIIPAE